MFVLFILCVLTTNAMQPIEEEIQRLIVTSPKDFMEINSVDLQEALTTYLENSGVSQEALHKVLSLYQENKMPFINSGTEKPPLSFAGINVVRQLSEILEALWYQPVMVLLENNPEVHRDAKLYLGNLISSSYIVPNFSLMKFNETDVSPILANITYDKKYFLKLLERPYSSEPHNVNLLQPQHLQKNALFLGLLRATQVLQYNNAIFAFTDRQAEDEDLAQLAVKEMLEKKIKLYIIWGGLYTKIDDEAKILKEVANITGGLFVLGNTERKRSQLYRDSYYKNKDSSGMKTVIAIYTNVTGYPRLSFPIDQTVSSIHITVTSQTAELHAITPEGIHINLRNEEDVGQFSLGSFISNTNSELDLFEVHFVISKYLQGSILGVWHLDVKTDNMSQNINISVAVQTYQNISTSIKSSPYTKDSSILKKVVRITMAGDVNTIRNISLLDKSGTSIINKLNFKHFVNKTKEQLTSMNGNNISNKFEEVDIEFTKLPLDGIYLKVSGEDNRGYTFSRLTYFDKQTLGHSLQPLTVEVGTGSELITRPNQQAKIFFEVTNNRDRLMYVSFKCQDEKSFLSSMQPTVAWLHPGQTTIVTVTTYTPSVIVSGLSNLITFTVSGPEKAQKIAAMYVSNNPIVDTLEPQMTHKYKSDCMNVLIGNCEDGTWVIEVTAEDVESGLLQLTSQPKGLYFYNGYMVGTKQKVVGTYGDSCCRPKLQLTAIDLLNNRRSYTANAYNGNLSAGSIAAIILGIILIIVIIATIIYVCKNKCCKEKESVDFPLYRSPHGNTQSSYAARTNN